VSYAFNHLELIGTALRRTPLGLITDVDGTISPTAPTPQQASVSPLCHHYLSLLCNQLALVAAISGRTVAGVKNMVAIDGMVYIGNHGLERWRRGRSEFPPGVKGYTAVIKAAIEELTPLLGIKGVSIENKGVTASIHYRLCPDPQSAQRHILAAMQNLPQASRLRITQERMAIGLIPAVAVNKGTAVLDLIRDYKLQGGVYLGDDLTDIYAFRAVHDVPRSSEFRGFAIGVVSQEMPENLVAEADFTLDGVSDVERFLRWLSETAAQSR